MSEIKISLDKKEEEKLLKIADEKGLTIQELINQLIKKLILFCEKDIDYSDIDTFTAMKISEPSFARDWDNNEDDIYDTL